MTVTATVLNAAISIPPSGTAGPLTFNALPTVADGWSVLAVGTAAGTYTDTNALDAAVIANTTAAAVNGALTGNGTQPPAQNATPRWNSAGFYLQTRPTGIDYQILMATLQNNTGGALTQLYINYDWNQGNNIPVNESVAGHRVFFSLTGAAGSWTLIPELSNFDNNSTAQNLTAQLNLGSWPNGGTLYIIWIDDNGPGSTTDPMEGGYTIDNFIASVNPISPIIQITAEPSPLTVTEGQSATFSVAATGIVPQYQWYHNGLAIPDATNSTYFIPVVYKPLHEGTYWVIVTNTLPSSDESLHVALTVIKDTAPPRVGCAYASNDNVTVFVVFNEPVTNALQASSYTISPAAGGDNLQVTNAAYADGTFAVVALTIDGSIPMGAVASYNLFVSGVDDRFGNTLINSPMTRIARFPTSTFLPIDADHIWRFYNPTSNVSLGTAWTAVNYNDSGWSNGAALLGVETAALPEPLRSPFAGYVAGAVRTFYFRTSLNFPDNPSSAVLCLRTVVDDGAVFHLNGSEIFRLRMPEVYDYSTEAPVNVGDAVYEGPFYVCVSNLVQGANVLAVEVHQNGATSSDIVMGVAVSALVPTLEPIVITQDPTGGTISEGGSFTFSVGFTGTNPRLQWYQNNNPISGATNATYRITCAPRSAAGQYHVVIQNDLPSSDTSTMATLNVTPDNTAPHIVCAYFGSDVGPSNTIIVVYSEVVTNAIEDVLNYAIQRADGGQPELSAAEAFYTAGTNNPCANPSGGTTVMLVLHESTPREPGVAYNLTTGGIRDVFGNEMSGQTAAIAGFPRLLFGIDGIRQWRYDDTGNSTLGTAWKEKTYVDTSWSSGAALFDAKKTNNVIELRTTVSGQPVNTHIALSNAANTLQISAVYFRTHFTYSGALGTVVLCIRPFVDDAAVYYLNGAEILRTPRMPPGTITYSTLATASVDDANFEGPFYVCVTNLMAGDNVLAVEVHQNSLTSSDITFGTELTVLQGTPPASLAISYAGGMVHLTWSGPSGAVLEAASSVSGTWSSVGVNQSKDQTFATSGATRFFRVRETP